MEIIVTAHCFVGGNVWPDNECRNPDSSFGINRFCATKGKTISALSGSVVGLEDNYRVVILSSLLQSDQLFLVTKIIIINKIKLIICQLSRSTCQQDVRPLHPFCTTWPNTLVEWCPGWRTRQGQNGPGIGKGGAVHYTPCT